MRINKYLSEHGYCSRREADRLISAGRVFVNERPAKLGDKITESDLVRVEGRDRKRIPKKVYILVNKPVGIICTTDKNSKDNIVDFVGHPELLFPVGRLDVKSEGLILLTNDGVLANRMMHPRYEHEKEYVVTVDRPITRKDVIVMQHGVELDDGMTLPAQVRHMDEFTFAIILKEGRNRQIRRMCEAMGFEVVKLKRTRILSLKMLNTYPAGNWRYLSDGEVNELKRATGMTVVKKKQPKPKVRR